MVTGIGALTTAGTDPGALWEAYVSGRDCTTTEDGIRLGRVEFAASDYLSAKERKRVDRLSVFSIIASNLALADAGLELTDDNRNRVGAIVGTGVGPMESMEAFAAPVMTEGPVAANPALFPNTVYNAAGGQIAIKVGAHGSASTVTVGHAAGASALCYGADLTATDHADAILCLGVDTLTEMVIDAYRGLGVLAGEGADGDDVGGGLALAEAGVALLVERLGSARERSARIYGEVLGFGMTCDGLGVGRIDPTGDGIERAMRAALEHAAVGASDIAAVWASSCGLKVADDAESAALARVFGDGVRVIAPKLALGEPMGAGGSINVALALKGWERADEEASPRGPVIVNSVSLGGANYSICLAPVEGP